ncbi:MAG: hypothetical protein AAF529_09710 [Pseudomonadota bacterium]
MRRRTLLQSAALLPLTAALPQWGSASAESPLIYLSPVKSDGNLSRCQAEVWYVGHEDNFYVVTDASAWRARAVGNGLTKARVWVGDVGMWRRSNGKYLKLPSMITNASLVNDALAHAELLAQFGTKYSAEWGTWGPRFKNGLADGSRVMLKYSPA